MNVVDLLKKNVVMVPVVASLIVGTFTGVKYIVDLTETINKNHGNKIYKEFLFNTCLCDLRKTRTWYKHVSLKHLLSVMTSPGLVQAA